MYKVFLQLLVMRCDFMLTYAVTMQSFYFTYSFSDIITG